MIGKLLECKEWSNVGTVFLFEVEDEKRKHDIKIFKSIKNIHKVTVIRIN